MMYISSSFIISMPGSVDNRSGRRRKSQWPNGFDAARAAWRAVGNLWTRAPRMGRFRTSVPNPRAPAAEFIGTTFMTMPFVRGGANNEATSSPAPT